MMATDNVIELHGRNSREHWQRWLTAIVPAGLWASKVANLGPVVLDVPGQNANQAKRGRPVSNPNSEVWHYRMNQVCGVPIGGIDAINAMRADRLCIHWT
jgi:hypothetical protein